MLKIIKYFDALKRTSSTIAKIDLLRDYLQNDKFRIIVEMALDETMHYNIKKLPAGEKGHKYAGDFDYLINFVQYKEYYMLRILYVK